MLFRINSVVFPVFFSTPEGVAYGDEDLSARGFLTARIWNTGCRVGRCEKCLAGFAEVTGWPAS